MLSKKCILSINISNGSQQDFVDEIFHYSDTKKSSYICFANAHMLVAANDSQDFKGVINSADIVAPDGFPVAKSFQLIHGIKQHRIDGSGIMQRILTQCPIRGKKVFFYGGTQQMLDDTRIYLRNNYPGIQIAGMYAPPFRPLDENEKETVINQVKAADPDFIFVVLGCPKQESWMHEMKGRITAVMLGIGGALPMALGIQRRAPLWLQQIGFEWLFRLAQEPGRLFQRYAVTNTKFIYLLTIDRIKSMLLKFGLQ
jgi:N-acetylglucosaminyldiphosphoundecaprenol N-acetyl-beta-D-mannosaminyltransferase